MQRVCLGSCGITLIKKRGANEIIRGRLNKWRNTNMDRLSLSSLESLSEISALLEPLLRFEHLDFGALLY